MGAFESLRSAGRIVDIWHGEHIDLPFDLDEDPDTLVSALSALRSLGGQVQTQSQQAFSMLRLRIADIDEATLRRWKLFYDRILQKGLTCDFIRDRGRFFWLAGDSERDVCSGFKPRAGSRYTMVTAGGVQRQGALSVDLDDPASTSRTNLIPNSDYGDGTLGATPTGYTVTASTLAFVKSQNLPPGGDQSYCGEFIALATGTKTAYIDTPDLGGIAADAFPSDRAYFSCLMRSDIIADSGSPTGILTLKLIGLTGPISVTIGAYTPTNAWTRVGKLVNTSTFSATDHALRLQAELSDDLALGSVYIAEVQLEARKFATAFVPYSTVRTSLTGSRGSDDILRYTNALWYRHQLPSARNAERFAFTVAFRFTPGFTGSEVGSATIVLYADGDTGDIDTVPVLRISAVTDTGVISVTLTLANGTTATVTGGALSFTAFMPIHFAVSVRDWDGATPNSGTLQLWLNGSSIGTATFSHKSARQGKFFWLGSAPDGSGNAGGSFSDVAVDPVLVDGSSVIITEYYYAASDTPIRPDRNAWRAVLDPGQKGRSDTVQNNTTALDCALWEVVA